MSSKAKAFSHIYIESAVMDHPRTSGILKRFPRSTVVEIDDYQNVFGRGRQDFWTQKGSPKLVLALKKDQFLYEGNAMLQGNASPNFCYNALVLNCPYDCHYCYLQGMYPGANIVAFLNLEDYFAATEKACQSRKDPSAPLSLAISYDTDLLALEGILGFAAEWVEWTRARGDIQLEIRTKSSPMRFLRETAAAPNVRLSWTLSPEEVIDRYEPGTAPLEARIRAMTAAAAAGWPVQLCIDPILQLPDGGRIYDAFMDRLGKELPWEAVVRAEIGVFRVGSTFFKRMLKRPDTDLLHYPYEHGSNEVSYNQAERQKLVKQVYTPLVKFLSKEKVLLWT